MTEAAGGDGTDIFSDIGHSSFASSLADMYLMWGAGEKKKIEQEKSIRAPYTQRQYAQVRPNRFQVHMKRDRYFAERLILRDNLIVRNTASFCRNRNGSRQTLLHQDVQGLEIEDDRIRVEAEIEGESEDEVSSDPENVMIFDNSVTIAVNDSISSSTENIIISNNNHTLPLPLPPIDVNTTIVSDIWPLGINLNLDISSNISAGIDHITTSLSLPKSVLSLRESIYLANAKASNFLRRGTMRNRLRDCTAMKSMAPTLFTSHECKSGRKHSGKLRMFYNPVDLQWWGWWTCCGMGELSVDIKEEESLCLQVSDHNISYKIC